MREKASIGGYLCTANWRDWAYFERKGNEPSQSVSRIKKPLFGKAYFAFDFQRNIIVSCKLA